MSGSSAIKSTPDQAVSPPHKWSAEPLVSVVGLRRSFGETIALADCSFEILPGEIHALVGENGSGKSTLIKILSGILPEDGGEIRWDGKTIRFHTPQQAQKAGIATVFQETLVLDQLSVRDNVVLGLDSFVRRRLSTLQEKQTTRAALDLLGLTGIHVDAPVAALSLAQRQCVTIARALSRPWRLLILDEATSALDIEARERLFDALRRFRAEERSILFVSHRMDEILELAGRSTVLRSGRSVATLSAQAATRAKLFELMSTREEARAAEGAAADTPRAVGSALLTVRGMAVTPTAPRFDLTVSSGEIVGVAGLEGHGQVSFLECVAGLGRPAAGSVEVEGHPFGSYAAAARRGIAYLPRDRKSEGIFPPLSVLDNLTVSALARFSLVGLLRAGHRRSEGDRLLRQTRVTAETLGAPTSSLSGGNQQKVLLGRLLATRPRILVLNDPMRGVDLRAKQDIYDVLKEFAGSGGGILFLSTELAELCVLCDRVAVFHNNALFATVERRDLDVSALISAMFGRSVGSSA
jgi:ABC-type sugar transport system ATPase subunit